MTIERDEMLKVFNKYSGVPDLSFSVVLQKFSKQKISCLVV